MNFIEAIKTGRPIRRFREGAMAPTGPWIVVGEKYSMGQYRHPWLRIDTGEEITLAVYDYTAEDWQAQP